MKRRLTFRLAHRYIGFFLLGIMSVYALSGVVLVFRPTKTFKTPTEITATLSPGLDEGAVGEALKIRRMRDTKWDGATLHFEDGTYNKETGEAQHTRWKYPWLIEKMTKLHKASTNDSVYVLNIIFGLALLFFSVSSFWMFRPKTKQFRNGMIVTAAGFLFTIIILAL